MATFIWLVGVAVFLLMLSRYLDEQRERERAREARRMRRAKRTRRL